MNYILLFMLSIILPSFSVNCLSQTPKLCINCKYFINNGVTDEYGKCSFFLKERLKSQDYDFLVNGIIKDQPKDYMYCSLVRSDENKCGIEGKMHKRKYNKKSIL